MFVVINIASSTHSKNEFDLFIFLLSRLYDYTWVNHSPNMYCCYYITYVVPIRQWQFDEILWNGDILIRSTYYMLIQQHENQIAYAQTNFFTQHCGSIGPHMRYCRPKWAPTIQAYNTESNKVYLFSFAFIPHENGFPQCRLPLSFSVRM